MELSHKGGVFSINAPNSSDILVDRVTSIGHIWATRRIIVAVAIIELGIERSKVLGGSAISGDPAFGMGRSGDNRWSHDVIVSSLSPDCILHVHSNAEWNLA